MNAKTNRYLIFALIAQAVIIMGMRVGGEPPMTMVSVKVFEGLDANKVTRIEVLGAPKDKTDDPPQNSVALAKEGATWGIATADGYPADATKVKKMLDDLAALRSRQVVLRKKTYHEKLEVAAEKYQRKVTLTHDGKTITFFLGTSPSFKSTHLRLSDTDEVLLVNDFATTDVGDRAWSWVDRAYVKHEKDDVWAVKVANAKGTIALEKNPNGGAWISADVAGELDTSVVNNIVQKASTVNLENPIGKTAKPEHGLDQPTATITLVTGTSTVAGTPPRQTSTQTIVIGKKLEKENHYYVKASSSPYVVSVAEWAIKPLLEKGPSDLVKKPDDAHKAPTDPKKSADAKKNLPGAKKP